MLALIDDTVPLTTRFEPFTITLFAKVVLPVTARFEKEVVPVTVRLAILALEMVMAFTVTAPVTERVLDRTVVPVTERVLLKMALPVMVIVFENAALPTTTSLPPSVELPETLAVPDTVNIASGEAVPIPTLPELATISVELTTRPFLTTKSLSAIYGSLSPNNRIYSLFII